MPVVQIRLVEEPEMRQNASYLSRRADEAGKPGKKAGPESEGSFADVTGDSGSFCPEDQMTQDDKHDEKQNIWRASLIEQPDCLDVDSNAANKRIYTPHDHGRITIDAIESGDEMGGDKNRNTRLDYNPFARSGEDGAMKIMDDRSNEYGAVSRISGPNERDDYVHNIIHNPHEDSLENCVDMLERKGPYHHKIKGDTQTAFLNPAEQYR